MTEKAQFTDLTHLPYIDQAKWYLNGFWKDGAEAEAENIWRYTQKFIELNNKKKEGFTLDEFWAHKFLEDMKETHTVLALREKLRSKNMQVNGNHVSLLEYLSFKYDKNLKQVVEAPQGDNQEEIEKASQKLQAVQDALNEVQRQLDNEQRALEAQRKQEEAVKLAEAELRTAVEELKSQEEAYHGQIRTLEAKSKDTSGSLVQRNKAANELAQLKGEDPLPLRRAKITQEAALRKVEKERKAAEAATAAAEERAREVEKAYKETEARFVEAQEYLDEVKRKGGVAYGAIWWMERELAEARKYLPKRKQ